LIYTIPNPVPIYEELQHYVREGVVEMVGLTLLALKTTPENAYRSTISVMPAIKSRSIEALISQKIRRCDNMERHTLCRNKEINQRRNPGGTRKPR
jgi:hypothetical protein